MRHLEHEDCELLTGPERPIDLRRQVEVEGWIGESQPQTIFLAAARAGGIQANDSRPAEFIYDNLMIEANVIDAAYRLGTEKLLLLGSSCIYPKFAPQPIREGDLLTGPLEPTNEWYAMAKIAGVKLCQAYRRQYGCDFISAMPTNLYGPGDNFDLTSSHVVPALMSKAHRARRDGDPSIKVWGSGNPRREFLHVDDAAAALIHLMTNYSDAPHVNVGTGEDVTIRELAEIICRVVEFEGRFAFDAGKPDGTPRKLLDVSTLTAAGWRASIGLEEGLRQTYAWYRNTLERGEIRA